MAQIEYERPSLPNFVKASVHGQSVSVDVADLHVDDLRRIGQQWTEALLSHAQNRREVRRLERNEELRKAATR